MLDTTDYEARPHRPEGINPGRARGTIRRLYNQEELAPARLSAPLLIRPDGEATGALPGEVDLPGLGAHVRQLAALGLGGVKLFVTGHNHDQRGTAATTRDNRMLRAIETIKTTAPQLAVTTEVCGCSWTSSHECVLRHDDGRIDRPGTYELMCRMAVMHAGAGADAVSPTAMLDGSIRAVRQALDSEGWPDVSVNPNIAIDSSLYEPFKNVMGTQPATGRRSGLQIDPARLVPDSVACANRWLAEGADTLTLQPVMTNADALTALAARTTVPVVAYSTSGEWAALQSLPDAVSMDYHRMLFRLGAGHVLSFAAAAIAHTLQIGARP
ncbi:porphobilinogen synthase [Promicromonospora umidemergens]|uniref:Delta-aminolevulinic acid dehydratase n=1 Tax=Promicromonospora umidemergens TaxID=629679 RepID=A0ABP8XIL7_9MICO|nr:porphobilinogen synthase [Promicromonospora umidemergens]MCP2282780.1 porphobilinogen synthase [Promicromonospora umidemergens]